jgi:hypothetical protein
MNKDLTLTQCQSFVHWYHDIPHYLTMSHCSSSSCSQDTFHEM